MALLHCGSLGKWQFSNNSGKSGVIAKLLAKQALIAKWTSRFVQVVGYMLHGNIHKPNVEIVETPAFRHIYSFKWFFMTYLMKSITWTKRSREGRSVDLARIGTVLNIMRHVCPSVCWKIKKNNNNLHLNQSYVQDTYTWAPANTNPRIKPNKNLQPPALCSSDLNL